MNISKFLAQAVVNTGIVRGAAKRLARRMAWSPIEPLESRVLLDAVIHHALWKPVGGSTAWDDPANWQYDPGDAIGTFPNDFISGGVYQRFQVTIDNIAGNTPTLTLDRSFTVEYLTVQGNATNDLSATINFNATANASLSVAYYAADFVGGNIYLSQANGKNVSLTISNQNPGLSASVTALSEVVNGDTRGSSSFIVGAHVGSTFDGNIEARGQRLNLSVTGELDAVNAYLTGKDITTGEGSAITVAGTLDVADDLDVGGNGHVNFTSSGTTIANDINVGHGSQLDISGAGQLVTSGRINVGDFAGETSGINTLGGGPLSVEGYVGPAIVFGLAALDPDIHLGGGNGSAVLVNGGKVYIANAVLDNSGALGSASPQPLFDVKNLGTSSGYVEVSNEMLVGLGNSASSNGRLVIESGARVNIAAANGGFQAYGWRVDQNILSVAGELDVVTANFGRLTGLGDVGANIVVTGLIKANDPAAQLNVGDGNWRSQTTIDLSGGGTLSCTAPGAGGLILLLATPQPINKFAGAIIQKGNPAFITPGFPPTYGPTPGTIIGDLVAIGGGGSVRAGVIPISADLSGSDFFAGRDASGNLITSSTSSETYGQLTIDGQLDSSYDGLTIDAALGSASNVSSVVVVSGEANLSGDLLNKFVAVPTDYSYLSNYTNGMTFTILEAATINNSLTVPTFSASNVASATSSYTSYNFGDPIPAAIAAEDLPTLSSGLYWTLREAPATMSVGTNSVAGIALQLAVSDFKPSVVSATAGGIDGSNFQQYYTLNMSFNGASFTSVTIEAAQRVDYQDGLGLRLPPDGATLGNYSTVARLTSFSAGTDGYYHDVVDLNMGAYYGFKLVGVTPDGTTITGDLFTLPTAMPATITTTGLSFAENQYTNNTGGTITINPWNSMGLPLPTWTDSSVEAIDGWALRTDGNYFGDEWVDGSSTIGGSISYGQSVATWLNGTSPVQFLAWGHTATGSFYAAVTLSPSTASHMSYSDFLAMSSADRSTWTLWAFDDRGEYPAIEKFAEANGSVNDFMPTIPAAESGFPYGGGVLTVAAQNTNGAWTFMAPLAMNQTPAEPNYLTTVAIPDATGVNALGVNLSWTDESDNEAGFLIQRGIVHYNSTAVDWSTVTTVTGTSYTDDFDFQDFSGYAVEYSVQAVGADSSVPMALYSTPPIYWERYVYSATSSTITLTQTGSDLYVTDGGTVTDYPLSDIKALTINAGSGNETVIIDQTTQNLSSVVVNLSGSGNITLDVLGGTMDFTNDLTAAGTAVRHLTVEASANAALTFDAPQTLDGLIVDSGSTIVLNADVNLGTVTGSGTLTLGTASALTATGNISVATLVNNGLLAFNSTGAISVSSTISGTGGLSQLNTGTTTLSGWYQATGPVDVEAGLLAFAATCGSRQSDQVLLKFQSLTIADSGMLDTANFDLIVGNTSAEWLSDALVAGFTQTTGGLTSSTAIADGNKFIVPVDAAMYSVFTFDGVSVTEANSFVTKYAWFGDVNLDGMVNMDDLSTVVFNYGETTPGLSDIGTAWLMGDTGIEGVVDFGSLSLVVGNFNDGVGDPL